MKSRIVNQMTNRGINDHQEKINQFSSHICLLFVFSRFVLYQMFVCLCFDIIENLNKNLYIVYDDKDYFILKRNCLLADIKRGLLSLWVAQGRVPNMGPAYLACRGLTSLSNSFVQLLKQV